MPSNSNGYPSLDYEQELNVNIVMFGNIVATHNVTIKVRACSSFESEPFFEDYLYDFKIFVGDDWLFTLPIAKVLENGLISSD